MPAVTGSLRDIIGSRMHFKDAEILFELNDINVVASGGNAGGIRPTEPVIVLPDETDGTFTVDLNPTTLMINEAWYRMRVRWQGGDAGGTLIDFPDWRIVVPVDGGSLDRLITDSDSIPGGSNGRMVYVSLTAPPKSRPWSLWLQSDPNDPSNSNRQSSGNLYELRNI